MADTQRLGAISPLLLALATLVLGWITIQDRLHSFRPLPDRATSEIPTSEQNVTARLWEDPLPAVHSAFNAEKSAEKPKPVLDTHGPDSLRRIISRNSSDGRQILLLVVPIPPTSFPDDIETRLRSRYSIQMALAQSRFGPDDRVHLGYVLLSCPGPAERVHGTNCSTFSDLPDKKQVPVAYEWFTRSPGEGFTNTLKTLTLWLPEDFLGSEPLCRLAYLRQQLLPEGRELLVRGPFVVGPRSSNTLLEFARPVSVTGGNHCCADLLREKLKIFSPQATAPDAVIGLPPRQSDGIPARESFNLLLAGTNFFGNDGAFSDWRYFENFIATDETLTDLLAQELMLRRIKLTNASPDPILILAEADTAYGRSLPKAFAASIQRERDGRQQPTDTLLREPHGAAARQYTNNIFVARYLRGLDGKKGQAEAQGTKSAQKAPASIQDALAALLDRSAEVSQGEFQLDYTERLVDQLATEMALRGQQIKAIGILGSDIYDKLILLQALRSKFRSALFFTTDLDARLTHPNVAPFTRNLLVASAYGLSESESSSSSFRIAPFRDVYQVAMYRAANAALRTFTGELKQNSCPLPPYPQIFELGRNNPVPLATREADRSRIFDSFWSDVQRNRKGLIFTAFSLCCAALVYRRMYPLSLGGFFSERHGWAGHFLVAASIVLPCAAFAMWLASGQPQSEPWSWSEGVSAWPAELIRLGILITSIWMITLAYQRFRSHRDRLRARYFAGAESEETETSRQYKRPGGFLRRTAWYFERGFDLHIEVDEQIPGLPSTIKASTMFTRYTANGRLLPRLIRVLLFTVIYFIFGFGIMLLLGGGSPKPMLRGPVVQRWDFWMLMTTVFASSFLLFYVLDAVRLSAALLKQLAQGVTAWPQPVVQQAKKQFGVSEDSDVSGYLDVRFAAEKTQEIGFLLCLPFIVQFLTLVARTGYWERWLWQPNLIFILVCNALLAFGAWFWLRGAGRGLRQDALDELGRALEEVEANVTKTRSRSDLAPETVPSFVPPWPAAETLVSRISSAVQSLGTKTENQRIAGIKKMQEAIRNERRGAYSNFVQDPALVALLIPTGLLGLVTILLQLVFGMR